MAESIKIVHLGVGGFHRGHQAVYINQVLKDDPRWGICGVSLKRPVIRDLLQAQHYQYHVLSRDAEQHQLTAVSALKNILVAPERPSAVVQQIADPAISLITLTITEKGYCCDLETGDLLWSHADIEQDCNGHLTSAIGFLVAGLAARQQQDAGPVTIISCDNVASNGDKLAKAVHQLAAKLQPQLLPWLSTHISFANSMVDRIVPATQPVDHDLLANEYHISDPGLVVCEPFCQWVIEDKFVSELPDLAAYGVEIVNDVKPYEDMKLRILNTCHSALAYMGFLQGDKYISDAVQHAALREFLIALTDQEIIPNLSYFSSEQLQAYRDRCLQRFANPVLGHTTYQVAMDGTQKLAIRVIPSLMAQLATGGTIQHLCHLIASWMQFASGKNKAGKPHIVQDPLAKQLMSLAAQANGHWSKLARDYLSLITPKGSSLDLTVYNAILGQFL